MTNEQLRMQMLSGIITESEYKEKISLNEAEVTVKDVEDRIEMYTKRIEMLEKALKKAQDKIAKEKKKAKPNQYNIEKELEDVEFTKDEIKKDKAEIKYDQKRLEKLKKKESLNEHFIAGGIVGVGAINQIPSRAKADYEMAFEHFLGERYLTNFENREQDPYKMEEGKEVEEPSLYENTVDLSELSTQINTAFDSIENMPLDPAAKLQMAKFGLGLSLVKGLLEKAKQEGSAFSKPGSRERFQSFVSDIQNATSVEEVKQALLNVIQLANS
jgi:hypothetical protein